jgi:hypothetical protein
MGAIADSISSAKHAIYLAHQAGYSAWAERRYRDAFDRVSRFTLFVGYPRSGHSLVGALLNAHRDAVISHELDAPSYILAGCARNALYARILARAYWFDLRGNTSNHVYAVPGQWQGRFAELRTIGDKRGGAVTRAIAAHPDFLERVRSLVRVPLRLVHVVRNPFDNIAAISIWHDMTLEQSVDYYFEHARTTAKLEELCENDEVVTLHHEDLLANPEPVLVDLCGKLGLDLYPGYLEDCRRVLLASPTYTRRKRVWPASLLAEVERRMRAAPVLSGYTFDIATDRGRV